MSDANDFDVELLIRRAMKFARDHMSQPQFDASHDYSHIRRVLKLAEHILHVEQGSHPQKRYDQTALTLSALLHDIGDHKYVPESPSVLTINSILENFGAPSSMASKVQIIVENVSFSNEVRNPATVRDMVLRYPELAIVQDADRLDALGAVGIGRAFTYGEAKGNRGEKGMTATVEHFHEKLEKLEDMMKTTEGKRLAKERTERLKMFRAWWEEEMAIDEEGI